MSLNNILKNQKYIFYCWNNLWSQLSILGSLVRYVFLLLITILKKHSNGKPKNKVNIH